MNHKRVKILHETAVYHCMSRTVAGEMLFDDRCKSVLCKQIWQVADFAGLEVLAYCVMSNHFHVMVKVPQIDKDSLSDEELIRRVEVLYKNDPVRGGTFIQQIKKGGQAKKAVRKQLLSRMGDVSVYMKELKQRFSIWYNKNHTRFGTLWAERFTSVIVENTPYYLTLTASYINLNPVRAKMVVDPADYRFSSYTEAIAGSHYAQNGIKQIIGTNHWGSALAHYRVALFGRGAFKIKPHQGYIPPEKAASVIASGGKLPLHQLLLCKLKFITKGMIIGSQDFVGRITSVKRSCFKLKKPPAPYEIHLPCDSTDSLASQLMAAHRFR